MYTINYVSGIIQKNKSNGLYVRIIKIINFLLHICVIGLLLASVFLYFQKEDYNKNINLMKNSIDEKRKINKIADIEQEWDSYYYKLLAVKEQLSKKTNYCLVLRDLGSFLPEDDYITAISVTENSMEINLNLTKEKLKEMSTFYDYGNILQMAFDKSVFLGKEIAVESMFEEKIKNKVLDIIKIKIPVYSRK